MITFQPMEPANCVLMVKAQMPSTSCIMDPVVNLMFYCEPSCPNAGMSANGKNGY